MEKSDKEVSAVLQIGIGVLVLVCARVLWFNLVLVPNGWEGKWGFINVPLLRLPILQTCF